MFYGALALFVVLITVLDQITKAMTVANIPLYAEVGVIDGFFHFTYIQNTGAAFSSFEGMRWLFVLIFTVLTLAIGYELVKQKSPSQKGTRLCRAMLATVRALVHWSRATTAAENRTIRM